MIISNLVICLWLLCVRLDQVTNYMSDNESCGDSVSSRGFRGDANYYTGADDKVGCLIYVTYFSFTPLFPPQRILQFIVENGRCEDTGGIVLWQLMEDRQVILFLFTLLTRVSGGGGALLAVNEGEVQEEHPEEARLI